MTYEKRSELRNLLGIETNKNESGDFFQSAEPEVEPEVEPGIEPETGDKEFEMAEPDSESDGSDRLISDDEAEKNRKKKKSKKSRENVEIEVESEEMKKNREELELLFSSSDEEKHFDLREDEKIKKLEKKKLKKKRFTKKVIFGYNVRGRIILTRNVNCKI